MSKILKILLVSYEVAPFYKQGGLADVAGSLPKVLKQLGADIRIIMPYYHSIKENFPQIERYKSHIPLTVADKKIKVNIFKSRLPGSRASIYFIDAPRYFQVKNIFDKKMKARFVAFGEMIIKILQHNSLNWQPHIIHNNDWQAAIIPIFTKQTGLNYKTLLTIHNIGYAGRVKTEILNKFNFFKNLKFSQIKNGKVNLLREAILNSDKINTVSPTYAKEILRQEYGYDMADTLRKRKKDLSGILNGLDEKLWNPASDKKIVKKFNHKNTKGKEINKFYLQQINGLATDHSIPLIGMVSRLAGQKGFDLLKESFDELMNLNCQLVILGTGAKEYERFFKAMNKKYAGKFKAWLKFDGALARQIYAGADMFLMPSLYEPCGLGQMIAMRYGTVPIVRETGGLKDTVKAKGGFTFKKYNSQAMLKAIEAALLKFKQKTAWKKTVKLIMRQDFSWEKSAKEYLRLYKKML